MKRRGSPATFETRAALMQGAADFMAEALQESLDERGAACALLSGGSTPEAAYALLAARNLDWRRITFGLVDERFVPPDHEASNERMLRRALSPALSRGAQLLPLYSTGDLNHAADRADAVYAKLPLDLVMLGMGEDGHTASWFADAENFAALVAEDNPRTIMATHAPSAAGAPERLTLTFSAYMRACRVGLLITGQAKLDLATEAYMHPQRAPVGYVFRNQTAFQQVLWAS